MTKQEYQKRSEKLQNIVFGHKGYRSGQSSTWKKTLDRVSAKLEALGTQYVPDKLVEKKEGE